MAEPAFSPFTERLYRGVPEHYRDADAGQPGDFPFKRFLALLGDQANELEVLVDRLDYVPDFEGGIPGDTSELVDPAVADVAWLAWLGQLVGAFDLEALTELEKRDAITFAPGGWRIGTKKAMAEAARTALLGTKYARVYDHTTDVSAIGAASQWDVAVVTRSTETPDGAAVIAAVLAKHAKPSAVLLWHREYEASWAAIEAQFPTWADIEAAGSWEVIQEAGL